jgi:dihydroxyacetone kinase
VTQTNPTTALDAENKVVYLRPDAAKPQVSLVSGGGAGHEPSFAAFVGPGLLSGAVAGTIFASPSAEQIRRCILQRVEKSKGVLVVVMNYTGDVLNFGMAVEKAKAAGIEAEMIVVADDCGVGRERGGKVGRRGIAGTVLVQKIAGALAASGASLQEVHRVAKEVADNTVSIGSSLSHVHVPGRAPGGEDELKENEIEVGMGTFSIVTLNRCRPPLTAASRHSQRARFRAHDERAPRHRQDHALLHARSIR